MRRRRSGSAGFSLTEALVALAIAAFMAAVLTRFVSGTRVNAFKVREEVAMDILGGSLLERLGSGELIPGRTDGRSGVLGWHIDIAPIGYYAQARAISVAKPGASAGGVQGGTPGLTSPMDRAASGGDNGDTFSFSSGSSGFSSGSSQGGGIGGSTSATPGLASGSNRAGADNKSMPVKTWTPFHVTAVVNAPSGRSYAIDTIRLVPQKPPPRHGQAEQN